MRTERVAIARTESVFREVNERIAEGAERLDVQEANFLCECADPGCTTGVPVTLAVEKRDPLTAEVALDLDPRTGGQRLH